MFRLSLALFTLICASPATWLSAADTTKPVPAEFRPDMKQRLEALKQRQSRLPLPDPTPEDIASGRRLVNNGRLRSTYLPESYQNQFPRPADSKGTPPVTDRQRLAEMRKQPDYGFKTRLFWIVSRTNDCTYCLGHQELKLRSVGMTEDEIAALDSKWDRFPLEEQVALKFTRKLTLQPHLITAADIQPLKKFFTDAQLIDLVQTVANYNSVNRWTASTGIPQDRAFGSDEPSELETPTSEEFKAVRSQVAPLDYKPRPAWETADEVTQAIERASHRQPSVVLPTVAVARQVLAADTPGTTPPVWFQALAGQPQTAIRVWRQRQGMVRDGRLDPLLKAELAWVVAREDRAWYAAALAHERLRALGQSSEAIFATGVPSSDTEQTPSARAWAFARKLSSAPHTIVDADVADLRAVFDDYQVAEIIALVGDANSFDRLTEALQLPVAADLLLLSQK